MAQAIKNILSEIQFRVLFELEFICLVVYVIFKYIFVSIKLELFPIRQKIKNIVLAFIKPKTQKINRTFIVLGAGRSGTSLVAGGLKKMGINMGKKLLSRSPYNPKGHFENLDIIELNNKILEKAGGSVHNPPSEEAILKAGEELKNEIKAFIEKNKSELWGWKDPRTTLTIRCFLEYIDNPFLICCFRDPKEVAKSLNICKKIPMEEGEKLAREYNRRLIKFLKEKYA